MLVRWSATVTSLSEVQSVVLATLRPSLECFLFFILFILLFYVVVSCNSRDATDQECRKRVGDARTCFSVELRFGATD